MDDEELNEIALNFHRSGNLGDQGNEEEVGASAEDDAKVAAELGAMALDDLLKEARKSLLVYLLKALKQGMAIPQELAVLRALLKDNGMVMGDITEGAGEPSNTKAANRPIDLPVFQQAPYDLQ